MDINRLIYDTIVEIGRHANDKLYIMEVCGTHTQAVSHTGIRSILPPNIEMLSGPGCPVCVTDESHIDAAIELLNEHNVILATFGDMMRVKGTRESMSDQSKKRGNTAVVYSPLDCLELAMKNPKHQVVFFAVGFETTAPVIALSAKLARDNKLQNLSFLTSLKLMPPILHSILKEKQKRIHGLICPGHVAAVNGAGYFRFVTQEYGIPAAICGFEALDIAAGLFFISKQYEIQSKPSFANLYKTCVNESGNMAANRLLQEVFETGNANWRGIGEIKESSLSLSLQYAAFDALKRFGIRLSTPSNRQLCNCRDILLGNHTPNQCRLFGKGCTPQTPAGPCMISNEGSCLTYYRYQERGYLNG